MMWRLNFFRLFRVPRLMRNDYTLYYICPMHTLFTLFVYFSLLVYKDHNDKTPVLLVKVAFCLAFVYVLWEVPGVFRLVFRPFQFLLGYVDPKPGSDPMHEWFFRSGLDRYVWIHGMVCAFFHPRYEAALRWIDEQPAASPRRHPNRRRCRHARRPALVPRRVLRPPETRVQQGAPVHVLDSHHVFHHPS